MHQIFWRGLLVLGLALVLASCRDQKAQFPDAPDSQPNPLLVLGIDGATWTVMLPMIKQGELPHFAALMERGMWGEIIGVVPGVSPVVWTTYATGRFGRVHGILDFTYPYTPGPGQPVHSTQRLAPAIWNLASRHGLRVGMVGYFVSYPAEPIKGVNITEYAFSRNKGTSYPADALEQFLDDGRYLHSSEGRKAVWERFFPWDYKPDRKRPADPEIAEAETWVDGPLDKSLLRAEFRRRASLGLLRGENQFDLFITYFRLVDIASHALWYYHDDSDFKKPADQEGVALLGDVIPETYRYMDQVLGELLSELPDNTNVLVVSDHGFGSATGPYAVPPEQRDELTGNHRPDGIFIAAGPDINTGMITGLTSMEVMPLMVALLGLPVANDLPGKVDYRVLSESLLEKHPLTTVQSYGDRESGAQDIKVDGAKQAEVMKSLQGLGYVGSDFEVGDRASSRPYRFWAVSDHLIVRHLILETLYYVVNSDIESALGILREVARNRPELLDKISRGVTIEYQIRQETSPEADLPVEVVQKFSEKVKNEWR